MPHNKDVSYALLQARMDRGGMPVPEALSDYWKQRMEAAAQELAQMGIHLEDNAKDSALLADFTAYKLQNRDKPDAMPRWLRLELRERWLSQKRGGDATD